MKSKTYLQFVASLPCIHCGDPESQVHHIIGIGMGMMGGKASDIHTMPLCQECHGLVHRSPHAWPQEKWLVMTQLKALQDGAITVP